MSKKAQEVANRFNAQVEIDFDPVFHGVGFTYPEWPVITEDKPDTIQLYRWGLVPPWAKDIETAKKIRAQTLNAKSETVFEKPAYKFSIRKKRCMVVSTGFYEWQDCNKKKYPYFIRLKSTEIFSLAGIYNDWLDKATGEIMRTYSIITTQANPMMARIHNLKERMPVILLPERERDWLNPDLTDEQIKSFFSAIDERLMQAHTISRLITSRTENSNVPEVQNEFIYPELNQSQFSL
jgi:putative SOS response-associated peptidase YedK